MAYQKTEWKDHIVETPNRYQETANADGTVTLTKREGNIVQAGTPMSASNLNKMEQGILDAHGQLDQSARAQQTVKHGVSVLNGSQNAPVNLQIEGRTLIPMQNSVLDASKYYVQGSKKTWLRWADATTVRGVSKFTGKSERPAITRVENFEGKIAGSVLDNPHKFAYQYAAALGSPTTFVLEDNVNPIQIMDGTVANRGRVENNLIAQQIFSFNVIEAVERNVGRIPRATILDKVQWLKDNLVGVNLEWTGHGIGPSGNKASITAWRSTSNDWWTGSSLQTIASSPAKISWGTTAISTLLDADGFVHFIAYADASNGTIQTSINTDYVELALPLKPEAILHDPRVPLYEVQKSVYDELLVTIPETDVISRYPSVEGVTHLQNPYVMAEGENLLPPFSEWKLLHANASIQSQYELLLDATTSNAINEVTIPALPNQDYSFYMLGYDYAGGQRVYIYFDGVLKNLLTFTGGSTGVGTGFRTEANTKEIKVAFFNQVVGKFTFAKPMLTLGTVAKPFVPRNPSYALFETKLAKVGTVADMIFEQDGKFMKRKVVTETEIGGLVYMVTNGAGYKRLQYNSPGFGGQNTILTNHKGAVMNKMPFGSLSTGDSYEYDGYTFRVGLFNSDTGFGETYTPTADEMKAYFNGWKVKTADAVTFKPTAWASVADGSDAPTQTLAFVAANKALNCPPYKILSATTPVNEEIRAEGSITVNGLTQIEVGSGVVVREKTIPATTTNHVYVNLITQGFTPLKNQTAKILNVYKDGVDVTKKWTISGFSGTNGAQSARVNLADFDANAEYTVTYTVLNRQKFTTNAINVLASFANNVRAALEDVAKQAEDARATTSVNSLLIYEMLKRLKAGGL